MITPPERLKLNFYDNMKKDQFMNFYQNTPSNKAAGECFDAIEKALKDAGIYSPKVMMYALATVRIECGYDKVSKSYFKPRRESISEADANKNYGGRYGNTLPGDGYRYRGGGYIQLTFKNNYNLYKTTPETILIPAESARVLAEYFKKQNVIEYIENWDFYTARRIVNGWNRSTGYPNGYDEIMKIITQYLDKMYGNLS